MSDHMQEHAWLDEHRANLKRGETALHNTESKHIAEALRIAGVVLDAAPNRKEFLEAIRYLRDKAVQYDRDQLIENIAKLRAEAEGRRRR